MAKHDDDNRSDQMNPNNDAYWESRGYDGRPDDWQDRLYDSVDGYGNQHNLPTFPHPLRSRW